MSTTEECAHIVQALTKTMIYRTCAKCDGKLTVTFINSSSQRAANELYCMKCRSFVQDLNASYRLQMTVANSNTNTVENLIAFDEAIEPLMGCPASEFDQLAVEHPDIYDITANLLVGLYCEFSIKDAVRASKIAHLKPDRIIEEVKPLQSFAPVTSSIMTCRYWQDNNIDDLLDPSTKMNNLITFMPTHGRKRPFEA